MPPTTSEDRTPVFIVAIKLIITGVPELTAIGQVEARGDGMIKFVRL